MKYYLKSVVSAVTAFSIILSMSVPVLADNLYSEKSEEIVTKGVTYSFEHRLSTAGWQKIHALTIDLTSSNIEIAPVESSVEYGLKETALKLLNDSGAVAGVNLGMSGTSVIILVGVALETVQQIESQMLMRHYKGFRE